MWASKITSETKQKNILYFLGAQIAAINLLQCDRDKTWNYLITLWKVTSVPVAPLLKCIFRLCSGPDFYYVAIACATISCIFQCKNCVSQLETDVSRRYTLSCVLMQIIKCLLLVSHGLSWSSFICKFHGTVNLAGHEGDAKKYFAADPLANYDVSQSKSRQFGTLLRRKPVLRWGIICWRK